MKLYDYLTNGCLKGDFNCAEQIFRGANEAYGLGLSEESLKLSAGFGKGMGVCYTCGAVSGGVMALSHMFVKEYAHESKRIGQLTSKLIRRTEEELSTVDCKRLRELYRTPEQGCSKVIYTVAKILDEVIEEAGDTVC